MLNQNYFKMTFKKAIYLINFSNTDHKKFNQIENIFRTMQPQGFVFGIRVSKMNDYIITILKKIQPQYIVVDQKITRNIHDFYFYQLFLIKYVSERSTSKLIFENPETNIGASKTENIGFKFYYKLS